MSPGPCPSGSVGAGSCLASSTPPYTPLTTTPSGGQSALPPSPSETISGIDWALSEGLIGAPSRTQSDSADRDTRMVKTTADSPAAQGGRVQPRRGFMVVSDEGVCPCGGQEVYCRPDDVSMASGTSESVRRSGLSSREPSRELVFPVSFARAL